MFIEQPSKWLRWLYPSAIWRMDPNEKAVYLTFDDGPIPEATPWIVETLEKYGVKVAEVFASDGFVRGHSFRGYTVKSFSDIRSMYDDFVILLSFGTNREEVLDMLADIDATFEMFVPDMPVAGEEYFDREFYNTHYQEIRDAYDTLSDERSKNVFSLVIRYKLSG